MTKNISDHFIVKPKSEAVKLEPEEEKEDVQPEKLNHEIIKVEKEKSFTINIKPHAPKISIRPTSQKDPKARQSKTIKRNENKKSESKVDLKLKQEDIEIFGNQELEINEGKINLNIKTEVGQEFVINLPVKKVSMSINSSEKSAISCQFCNKSFGSNFGKNQHLKKSHSSELDFKDVCDSKLSQKFAEQKQQTSKSINSGSSSYECDFDGKTFKSKDRLSRHLMVHLPSTKCHICHVELKMSYFHYHIKTYHETDQKYQCQICLKFYKTQKQLRDHKKIHNKNFQCDICDTKFVTPHFLKMHKKQIHENPESYKCDLCNKKFNYKTTLVNHQRRHDKNLSKAFKCERCGFGTVCKKDLRKHQEFHTRKDRKVASFKNPQKCKICQDILASKQSLAKHTQFVHPKELFQCDLCGILIKSKQYIVKHINRHVERKIFKKIKVLVFK